MFHSAGICRNLRRIAHVRRNVAVEIIETGASSGRTAKRGARNGRRSAEP